MKYILGTIWYLLANIAMFGAILYLIENQLTQGKKVHLLPPFMVKWAQWIVDRT